METFDDDSATILKAIGSKVTMKELTTIQPNEEKLNDKEKIEIWKRKKGESGPSQWAQQCSSEWGDKELTKFIIVSHITKSDVEGYLELSRNSSHI